MRAGEILGIAGLIGAGRTELVRAIAGADPIAPGRCSVAGQPCISAARRRRSAPASCWCPRTARPQGVVLDQTIGDNLAFGNFDHVARRRLGLSRERVHRTSPSRHRQARRQGQAGAGGPGKLSGGNQQKVVIAKWLSRQPKVFILDEPTRGIDIGARAAIYDVIADLARSGMAVVVVSSDLEEVLGLSHRVLVLSRGGSAASSRNEDHAVMELATT